MITDSLREQLEELGITVLTVGTGTLILREPSIEQLYEFTKSFTYHWRPVVKKSQREWRPRVSYKGQACGNCGTYVRKSDQHEQITRGKCRRFRTHNGVTFELMEDQS